MKAVKEVQVLLPVHNEADCIERVVREIYNEFSQKLSIEFIICEDGSTDNTKEILKNLSNKYPMVLIMGEERKGYSRAVTDGMKALDAPYLLCLDSDGQCDPKDFWQFWENREKYDVQIGWRTNRADPILRKFLSKLFSVFYKAFFPVPIHDPSCPFILAKKEVIAHLVNEIGVMQQGFWWEFMARVYRRHYTFTERPVHHRNRVAGTTQVYKFKKMPGIFFKHFVGLFSIWSQTRNMAHG